MASGSKSPRRNGSLSAFSEVLPEICRELDLDKKVNELALLALWPQQANEVLGSAMAEHTKAVRLRRQGEKLILWVHVASAALAAELGFHIEPLKEALNRFTPQTGLRIDHIQWRVGSLK